MKNSNIKIYGGFIDYVAGTMNIYEYDCEMLEDGIIKMPYFVPVSMLHSTYYLGEDRINKILPLSDNDTKFVIYQTNKDYVRDCLQKLLNDKLYFAREELKKLENIKINELRANDVLKAEGIV